MFFLMLLATAAVDPTNGFDASGNDIIPSLFHGKWAPAALDCAAEDPVNALFVEPTSVQGYEFSAKLLKHAGLQSDFTTTKQMAETLTMLVAESGEGEVSIGRIRLSMVGKKLYFDRPGENAKAVDLKSGSYIKCPVSKS